MAKKVSNVTGVDIGSQKIKVVEVRYKGDRPEVTAMSWIDTPEGSVDHTGIYNPEAVGDALKSCLQNAGVSSKQVVVSVAGQGSVLVRTLEVPRMNEEELRAHMEWEINRNIPFAESDVMSAYKPLEDDDPNSPNMDVVMAISPKSAIDSILTVCQRAKKSPLGVDVEPLALARAFQSSHGEQYENMVVCLIDIGHRSTSINIYRNGKLLMPRQIPVGGEMFTKAIADGSGISLMDAEAEKVTHLRVPESEIEAARAYAANPFGGFDYGMGDVTAMPDLPDMPVDPSMSTQTGAFNPFADDPLPSNPFLGQDPVLSDNPFAEPTAPTDAMGDTPDMSSMYPPVVPIADPNFDPLAGLDGDDGMGMEPPAYTDPGDNSYQAADSSYDMFSAPAAGGYDPFSTQMVSTANEDPEVLRRYNLVRPVLEEFVAEVRRSVDYFRSRGNDINAMMLCGGGAYFVGLSDYLGASLGLECSIYNPFSSIEVVGKKVPSDLPAQNGSEFAMAFGTALHVGFE